MALQNKTVGEKKAIYDEIEFVIGINRLLPNLPLTYKYIVMIRT